MYTPLNFENLNLLEGLLSPSTIKSRNNLTYWYWYRQLYMRLKGLFEFDFDNVFNQATADYIITILLIKGFVGFAKDDKIGLFGQICNPKGYNFYYQPREFIVTNPYWGKTNKSKTYICGKDGVIVRSMPDYIGFHDILAYYAEKLSWLDESINISIINAKTPHIVGAKSKGAINAIKKLLDGVNKGNPAVFFDSRISDTDGTSPFQLVELFNKNKYVTDLLLADRQTILHDFDTEIGIKSIPYNKKERLSTDEVNIKSDESNTKLNVCLNTINGDFEEVNRLFNVNFKVLKNEVIESEQEGGADHGKNDDVGNVSV